MDTYTQDGVNVAEGDDFSAFAARVCAQTASPFVTVRDWSNGHFRGPRSFTFKNLPKDAEFDIGTDGIGTKVVIITEALSHAQAAIDVLAMTCADITRWGGKPLIFSNVLDVASLGESGSERQKLFRDAIRGLADAAKRQGILAYRGETAELGACVGSENEDAVTKFNWAGFALGVYDPKRVITGEKMRHGDVIVALKERGFRSNGMSSVRAALRERFGARWWENQDACAAVRAAARQSVLYDKFLAWANGWGDIPRFVPPFTLKCIAHISGGSIPSKFGEDLLFRFGLSATLDTLYEPEKIMRDVAEWRGMDERGCYGTWNGGQGVLVVLPQNEVARFIEEAERFGLEAKRAGVIEEGKGAAPRLLIHSKFGDSVLEYGPKEALVAA